MSILSLDNIAGRKLPLHGLHSHRLRVIISDDYQPRLAKAKCSPSTPTRKQALQKVRNASDQRRRCHFDPQSKRSEVLEVQRIDFPAICFPGRHGVKEIVNLAAPNTMAMGTLQGREHFLPPQLDGIEIPGEFTAEKGRILRTTAKAQPSAREGGIDLGESMLSRHPSFTGQRHAGALIKTGRHQSRGVPVGAHRASRSARRASAIAARGTFGAFSTVKPRLRAVPTTGTSAGLSSRKTTRVPS